MTTARTSAPRHPYRPGRTTVIVLLAAAGIALTPLPALASAPGGPPAAPPTSVAAANPAAQTAVDTALAHIGDPYSWGAAGPNAFDCSGLTQYAFAAAGVALPHSSRAQSGLGVPVAYADLRPGDLVFFYSPVSHVAMYIGNGQIVHASTYGRPVQVVNLAAMPKFAGARRIV
jgi:cell wall-associated NlpC family hydrolase